MYASIKDSNRLLINRLDNNEATLLKSMTSDLEHKNIEIEKLTGETGEFDGIMMNFKKVEPKVIETTGDILTEIKVLKNEKFTYVFPVAEDVNILIKHNNYEAVHTTSINNVITILSDDLVNDVIKYEIKKPGFESIYGEINVITELRTVAEVTVETTPEADRVLVIDINGTLKPLDKEKNAYILPLGMYTVKASKMDYNQTELNFEVTQEDLDNIYKTVTVDLAPISEKLEQANETIDEQNDYIDEMHEGLDREISHAQAINGETGDSVGDCDGE